LQASQEQLDWLSRGYEYLREFDKAYSAEHAMPESIKLTTIKPLKLAVLKSCEFREQLPMQSILSQA